MIAQQGRIVAIEGEDAVVRIGGTSGCPACDAGEGCGAGVFGRLLRNRSVSIRVPNVGDAQVGEAVQVGMPEARFLALVFRLYALPLLAGLVGAVAGHALATRAGLEGLVADLLTLLAALVAGWMALALGRRALREFPPRLAVHLLHGAQVPARADCMAPVGDHRPPTGPKQN